MKAGRVRALSEKFFESARIRCVRHIANLANKNAASKMAVDERVNGNLAGVQLARLPGAKDADPARPGKERLHYGRDQSKNCTGQFLGQFSSQAHGAQSEDVRACLAKHGILDSISVVKGTRHLSIGMTAKWIYLRLDSTVATAVGRTHVQKKNVCGKNWATVMKERDLLFFDLAILTFEFKALLMLLFIACDKLDPAVAAAAAYIHKLIENCDRLAADKDAAMAEFDKVMRAVTREKLVLQDWHAAQKTKMDEHGLEFSRVERAAAIAAAEDRVAVIPDDELPLAREVWGDREVRWSPKSLGSG